MDRRERADNLEDALIAALRGFQSDLWSACPGIVQSFDPVEMTCVVQPSIQLQYKSPVDGSVSWVKPPLLLDCPVFFPSGGGLTLTFPIANGDECLVVFSSRCIDGWWQLGGVQPQPDIRMHDLSDGFVFAGVRSQPRALSAVSTTSAQLRTDDGGTYIDIKTGQIKIVAPTDCTVETGNATVTATGNVNVTAGGNAVIKAASIALQNAGSALKALLNSAFATWAEGHQHTYSGGTTSAPTTSPGASAQTSVVQAE